MANPFDLTGRKALVTGGATGIGEGIALGLAAAGADVVLTFRSHQPEDTLGAIEGLGRKAAAVRADFERMDATEASEVIRFATEALGGLDILVNNAGIIHRENSVDLPLDDWRRGLSVNLDSVRSLACLTDLAQRRKSGRQRIDRLQAADSRSQVGHHFQQRQDCFILDGPDGTPWVMQAWARSWTRR